MDGVERNHFKCRTVMANNIKYADFIALKGAAASVVSQRRIEKEKNDWITSFVPSILFRDFNIVLTK
jgi:hypothetical protein